MKINLKYINREKFSVKEKDGLFLVNPNLNYVDYKKDELIFRSSIWDAEGNLVSAGFKKFFNWDENKLSKQPKDIEGCDFIEKIDGSLLICSKYKDKLIFRTRGTFEAYQFPNSNEIDMLRQKYNIDSQLDERYSLLFEWVTPSNKIVLNYTKPDLYLVGVIRHEDYNYAVQDALDEFADICGWKRPKRFTFNSIEGLMTVKDWINQEGICMYYNSGQSIVKIKSFDYLKKHSFKTNLNWERLVDMYWDWKESDEYDSDMFFSYIEEIYDYEIRKYVEEIYGTKLLNANQDFLCGLECADYFYMQNERLSRKEYALLLQDRFSQSPFVRTVAFKYLDGKEIDSKLKRNFYYYY